MTIKLTEKHEIIFKESLKRKIHSEPMEEYIYEWKEMNYRIVKIFSNTWGSPDHTHQINSIYINMYIKYINKLFYPSLD